MDTSKTKKTVCNQIMQLGEFLERKIGKIILAVNSFLLIVYILCCGIGFKIPWENIKQEYVGALFVLWGGGMTLYFITIVCTVLEKPKWNRGVRMVVSVLITVGIFMIMKDNSQVSEIRSCAALGIGGVLAVSLWGYNLDAYLEDRGAGPFNLVEIRDDRRYVPCMLGKIEDENLRLRIANEVCTYVHGAWKYKRRYYVLITLSISLPAIITAINSFNGIEKTTADNIVAVLSTLTVIVTGIMGTMKAKESWVRYRYYAEISKAEISNYVMKAGEYKKNDTADENNQKLAEAMEKIFMEERGDWRELRQKRDSGN